MNIEQTLVLLKPDAVKRGVVGEILHRFERSGLKVVGSKMTQAKRDFAEQHYLMSEEAMLAIGKRTLSDCEKFGVDACENMGSADAMEIGKKVWEWNVDFLTSGPVLAFVLEGIHAVESVRSMVGATVPLNAAPGTIRGDFSLDSAIGANIRKRTIYNLIHASGTVDEAKREINLWFKPEEIVSYRRVHEDLYKY